MTQSTALDEQLIDAARKGNDAEFIRLFRQEVSALGKNLALWYVEKMGMCFL